MIELAMLCSISLADKSSSTSLITHLDAAYILAKSSGLFDEKKPSNATPQECVQFFNRHGIYFSPRSISSNQLFLKKDCARIMGQLELVMQGKAEYRGGKVILPKSVESWEEYCILNDIKYEDGYLFLQKIPLSIED